MVSSTSRGRPSLEASVPHSAVAPSQRHHHGALVVPVYGHPWRLPRMSHSRVLPTSRGGCCYDHHNKVRNPVVSVFHPRTPDNFTTVVSLPFQGVTESHVLFRYSGALTLSSVFHPRTPTTSPPWCRRCSWIATSPPWCRRLSRGSQNRTCSFDTVVL